jgi:hypothetical protein
MSEQKTIVYHTIEVTMQLPTWAMLDVALRTWCESKDFPPPPHLQIDLENLANQISADLQHFIAEQKVSPVIAGAVADNSDLL